MDNNFASSIDSKHRHPPQSGAALAGAAARLWLCGISSAGQLRHPRILPLTGWLPKSSLSVSISRTTSHWKAPDDTHVWNLTLVNPWNPLPEDYSISLKQVESGQAVDQRCAEALQAMMDDCRAAGLSPLICSSYRTQETQQGLYDAQVNDFLAQGYSRKEAESMAATIVALPGTSEHQLGLAVDIVDQNYQILESSQEDTPGPTMADGALLGVWFYSPLSGREKRFNWHYLRTLALPLCGCGSRKSDYPGRDVLLNPFF